MLLETESFLTELTRMFQKSREAGSLVITMKRWDGHDKPTPRNIDKKPPKTKKVKKKLEKLRSLPTPPKEYRCLLRAALGSRKISTVVSPQEAIKFQASYSTLLRGNIDGLRKKDNKKKAAAAN
ncbi:signal recognition particle 14 kDa protein-like [Varroa jacobsoni]|uniref:Signal recognition particle 14 kDa protein n=1 Tax=Varroa destructor TaxID=109461 RepID=A0A7M7KAA3_VARDE|nr:signal recognition particle 14 kDa protein-like [Varroa destructor]XP_022689273.1 signal recognition particle 14 kDa protein-like [Varroa jacobsoni]